MNILINIHFIQAMQETHQNTTLILSPSLTLTSWKTYIEQAKEAEVAEEEVTISKLNSVINNKRTNNIGLIIDNMIININNIKQDPDYRITQIENDIYTIKNEANEFSIYNKMINLFEFKKTHTSSNDLDSFIKTDTSSKNWENFITWFQKEMPKLYEVTELCIGASNSSLTHYCINIFANEFDNLDDATTKFIQLFTIIKERTELNTQQKISLIIKLINIYDTLKSNWEEFCTHIFYYYNTQISQIKNILYIFKLNKIQNKDYIWPTYYNISLYKDDNPELTFDDFLVYLQNFINICNTFAISDYNPNLFRQYLCGTCYKYSEDIQSFLIICYDRNIINYYVKNYSAVKTAIEMCTEKNISKQCYNHMQVILKLTLQLAKLNPDNKDYKSQSGILKFYIYYFFLYFHSQSLEEVHLMQHDSDSVIDYNHLTNFNIFIENIFSGAKLNKILTFVNRFGADTLYDIFKGIFLDKRNFLLFKLYALNNEDLLYIINLIISYTNNEGELTIPITKFRQKIFYIYCSGKSLKEICTGKSLEEINLIQDNSDNAIEDNYLTNFNIFIENISSIKKLKQMLTFIDKFGADVLCEIFISIFLKIKNVYLKKFILFKLHELNNEDLLCIINLIINYTNDKGQLTMPIEEFRKKIFYIFLNTNQSHIIRAIGIIFKQNKQLLSVLGLYNQLKIKYNSFFKGIDITNIINNNSFAELGTDFTIDFKEFNKIFLKLE